MNTKKDEMVYVAPQVEVIEVQVERGFAGSNGNEDPTITNPEMGWG